MTYKLGKSVPLYVDGKEVGVFPKETLGSILRPKSNESMNFQFRALRKGMRVQGDGMPFMWKTRMNHHVAHKGSRMYLCVCLPGFRIGLQKTFPKGDFKREGLFLKKTRFFTSKGANIKWFLRQATKLATQSVT